MRRCVICGSEQTEDENGNPTYHYPKTKKEARIWQRSLHAENVTIDAMQKYCCVCMEHIPEFVDRSSTHNFSHRNYGDSISEYRLSNKKQRSLPHILKPPVNVLLMTGASLPTYCGKACADNDYKDDLHGVLSDTDICVLESNFSDCGISFPDVDEAEITVMRAPVHDDEKEKKGKALHKKESKKDLACEGANCTDVLLLAKTSNWDDECPCDCANAPCVEKTGPCCPPGCLPEPPPRFDDVPCGCECEQRARQELNDVIDQQAKRIEKLESLLMRQHEMQDQIIGKVDELHTELKNAPMETIDPTPSKTNTKRLNEKHKNIAKYRETKRYTDMDKLEIPVKDGAQKSNNVEIDTTKSLAEIQNDTKAEQISKISVEKSQDEKTEEKPKQTFLKKIQRIMTRNPTTKEKSTRMHGLVVTRDQWDSD